MKYIVVKSYSFDPETKAYDFDDYKKAKAFLHWWWEDDLNTELAENTNDVDEEFTIHEEDFARIEYIGGEYIQFVLVKLENSLPEEFENSDWSRYL